MFSPLSKLIKLIAIINGQPFTNVCLKEEILAVDIFQSEETQGPNLVKCHQVLSQSISQ